MIGRHQLGYTGSRRAPRHRSRPRPHQYVQPTNHAPLARFSDDRHREAEITGAFEMLKARGQDVDFVSLPFGMMADYGDRAVSCALTAGHAYVVEVENGTNRLDLRLARKF